MKARRQLESGAINGSIFAIVALVILVLVFGSFGIWAYINYMDQKNNVDTKASDATAKAVLDNTNDPNKKFEDERKQPLANSPVRRLRQFVI